MAEPKPEDVIVQFEQAPITGRVIQETVYAQPVSVEVTKTSKGYGWVLKVRGADWDSIWPQVQAIDQKLREEYGSEGS